MRISLQQAPCEQMSTRHPARRTSTVWWRHPAEEVAVWALGRRRLQVHSRMQALRNRHLRQRHRRHLQSAAVSTARRLSWTSTQPTMLRFPRMTRTRQSQNDHHNGFSSWCLYSNWGIGLLDCSEFSSRSTLQGPSSHILLSRSWSYVLRLHRNEHLPSLERKEVCVCKPF